jgi:hypothetical protein
VAHINFAHLEANLVNGIYEVIGVTTVSIDGDSFTLNVNATTPTGNLNNAIAQQIAKFLGNGYTPDLITIDNTAKKRALSSFVTVTIGVTTNSVSTLGIVNFYLMVLALLAFAL